MAAVWVLAVLLAGVLSTNADISAWKTASTVHMSMVPALEASRARAAGGDPLGAVAHLSAAASRYDLEHWLAVPALAVAVYVIPGGALCAHATAARVCALCQPALCGP